MKIGFIYTKFYPLTSSASVHGYQLVSNFKELGHEVLTIGIGPNELTTDYPKSLKGIYSFFRAVDVVYIRINPWLRNDWFTLIKLLSLGKKKVVWEINAPVEEVLASYKGIPPHIKSWIDKQNIKRKRLAKLCDASVGVSNILRDYSYNYLDIKTSVSFTNGSDPDLFKPDIKDINNPLYQITKDKFVVVWAGNGAISWQGTNVIGEVATKMNVIDKDVIFIIISNHSIYNSVISPNIISLGEIPYKLLPQFLNFGHVALCLYNDYDWCPYGFYNSPLKLYDYMAMGLPVIGSNMGQIAEVINDGQNGYLTNNKPYDIINKILLLKNDVKERNAVGEHARQEIISKYNWKTTAGETIKLIESIL